MNRERYDILISELQECIDSYEKLEIGRKTYDYSLSSGKGPIRYQINRRNIAHLLGVNTDFLRDSNLVRGGGSKDSYTLLKNLIEYANFIFIQMNQKKIPYTKIFSNKIEEKIAAFETNIRFNFRQIVAILHLDGEKIWQADMPEVMKADYFILKEYQDGYAVLGLCKSELGNYYEPISNMFWKSDELDNYGKYLRKQECTLPYIGKITEKDTYTPSMKAWISNEDKLKKLHFLNELADRYDMSVCLAFDYEKQLTRINKEAKEKEQREEFIASLSTVVQEKQFPIEVESIQDEEYVPLVNALNDIFCEGFRKNSKPYTETKRELEITKKQLEKMKDKNENLTTHISALTTENEALKRELELYKKTIEGVRHAMQALSLEPAENKGLESAQERNLQKELTFTKKEQ